MKLCSTPNARKTDGSPHSRSQTAPRASPLAQIPNRAAELRGSCACKRRWWTKKAGTTFVPRAATTHDAGRRTASDTRATRDDALLIPLVLFVTLVLLTHRGGGAAGSALVPIMHAATPKSKPWSTKICVMGSHADAPAAARSITLEDAGCVASPRTFRGTGSMPTRMVFARRPDSNDHPHSLDVRRGPANVEYRLSPMDTTNRPCTTRRFT
jgi:hypothetical protein